MKKPGVSNEYLEIMLNEIKEQLNRIEDKMDRRHFVEMAGLSDYGQLKRSEFEQRYKQAKNGEF